MVYRTKNSMDIVTPHNINYLIQHLKHVAIVEQNNLANDFKHSPPQTEEIIPQSSKKNGDKKEKKKKKKSKKGVQNKNVDQFVQDAHLPNHDGLRPFNSMTNLTKSIELSDYSGVTTIVINGLANQMKPSSSNEALFTTIESDETDIDLMFALERAKMGFTFQGGPSQIEAAWRPLWHRCRTVW
ncbi:hypothetical protein BLOT_012327 [Blomia tropicalis]|nr:hypothetical protein BLOT_012327 [Blomia tropicalis]